MVNPSAPALDSTFAALADPTRRAILARLAESECTVGELAEPFDMSLPAVSKHLRVLERAGLMERRRAGRTFRCALAPAPLASAADWLSGYRKFWTGQFDSLERHLQRKDPHDR